jgi:hypothetical protein
MNTSGFLFLESVVRLELPLSSWCLDHRSKLYPGNRQSGLRISLFWNDLGDHIQSLRWALDWGGTHQEILVHQDAVSRGYSLLKTVS